MKFRDFLGRGADVVGGISGDEEVDFGGIVFGRRGVGRVGINTCVPVVLAGQGEGAMCEMGVVGSAISPDSDGIRLQGVGKR